MENIEGWRIKRIHDDARMEAVQGVMETRITR